MSILGLGVDIIEVSRIRTAIERHGDRFYQRICTASEIAYCLGMRDAAPCFAARFAGKEAVSKALGTGIGEQCGWLEIEIRRKATGEPFVVLHGAAAATAKRLGIARFHLSLSHTENYATAQAIADSEAA